jgi:hypothetical protein
MCLDPISLSGGRGAVVQIRQTNSGNRTRIGSVVYPPNNRLLTRLRSVDGESMRECMVGTDCLDLSLNPEFSQERRGRDLCQSQMESRLCHK